MKSWSKEIILKVIAKGKLFKFVDSMQEVEEYCNKQIYAIEKNSLTLKELIKEGAFPVNNALYNPRKGYYYIINIYEAEYDIKGETRKEAIAQVLYRDKDSGDYWNKVYQIRLKPLFNFVSERLLNRDYNPYNLEDKTICIESFRLDTEKNSYKVVWYELGDLEKHVAEIEKQAYEESVKMENAIDNAMEELTRIEEAMEDAMWEKYLQDNPEIAMEYISDNEESYPEEGYYEDELPEEPLDENEHLG